MRQLILDIDQTPKLDYCGLIHIWNDFSILASWACHDITFAIKANSLDYPINTFKGVVNSTFLSRNLWKLNMNSFSSNTFPLIPYDYSSNDLKVKSMWMMSLSLFIKKIDVLFYSRNDNEGFTAYLRKFSYSINNFATLKSKLSLCFFPQHCLIYFSWGVNYHLNWSREGQGH